MTPTLLNHRYRIIRTLGRGGFGETFLVEDTQLPSGRHCVLKQLTPVENNSQIYQLVQERFQREAAILEDLGESSNGQIPRLYAYFAEGDKFYLVQEYIDGETLTQKLLTQGRMSEASVREILIGILSILDYIHNRRMVHRDIKPDNIILRRRDQKPVLIDFGAVKETMGTLINSQGNSTRSIIIGTPGFMPSEQAAGRPMYASDLYSLGLTAIYLLTGKMPQELGTDPLTGEIQWRQYAPNVSPSLAMVLDKAIRAHGRDRYQTAQQMLDAMVSGAPTSPPTAASFAAPSPTPDPTIAAAPNGYPNGYPNNYPNGYPNNYSPNNYSPNNYSPNNYSPNPQHNGYPNGYANVGAAPGAIPYANGTPSGGGYASGGASTQPIAQPPTPPPIPVSQTPTSKSGMSDWLKAMLMGSLIGGFILVGLFVTRPLQQSIDPQPSPEPPVSQGSDTDSGRDSSPPTVEPDPPAIEPSPPPIQVDPPAPEPPAPPVQVDPPIQVPPQASISQQDAIDLVDAWLQAKRVMFAPPYSDAPAAELTTGQLYTDVTKPNGSIDWLRNNNAYYQFGVQQIDSVQRFAANGNQATIEVTVTEDRTLYVNGRRDASQSGFETTVARYTLVSENGTWKISDYTVMD